MIRDFSLDGLTPAFRDRIVDLEADLERQGIPMRRWETTRSHRRQHELYVARPRVTRAAPGESPHAWGLAVDYVLDVHRVDVRVRAWQGKLVPDAWDYDTPSAAAIWQRFGRVVAEHGLTWGGSWTFRDPPHVEDPKWRAKRPADWRSVVAAALAG